MIEAKEVKFNFSNKARLAFNKLKDLFTMALVLAQFDPDRGTVLETDSSGWATGGVLS